ncbi:MAG: UDP-N-acetylmuramate--L-alanine ligase [Chitinophagaceae bacterium]|nr:UDP-N-acetylmuramate--L-alanine ligase [Chitinophagaceae bacterium]
MDDINKIVTHLISSPAGGGREHAGSVYFLGIGGIGMSALARFFKSKGLVVSGYDKTETVLTKKLAAEGIAVHYEDSLEFIDKEAELVVYTPAVPKDHRGLNYFMENNYNLAKRSEVLGAVTNDSYNICVAGTHGKTTTSTMVAHILRHSGYGCTAFLGGIAVNYNSNFWLQAPGAGSDKKVSVVEADEYDRSFLTLSPDVAIISSMDADHLDIYGTAENMEQAFIDFSARIKPEGILLSKYGLKRTEDLQADSHLTFHLQNENADIYAADIKMAKGSYHFDVIMQYWELKEVELNMGGLHNIENMIAAISVAHYLGIDNGKIKEAVAAFRGVKRRFEYVVKNDNLVIVDDYAHHPEELRALLSGAKALFPDKKCTVIFQPHLYSRTRDFAEGFAEVLDGADELILLPIYPARELPIEGVNSEMILGKMKNKNKRVLEKTELLEWIKNNKTELLITAGAGDIDTLVEPIKNSIEESFG